MINRNTICLGNIPPATRKALRAENFTDSEIDFLRKLLSTFPWTKGEVTAIDRELAGFKARFDELIRDMERFGNESVKISV